MDLRERFAAAVDQREGSQRQIARRFRVSLAVKPEVAEPLVVGEKEQDVGPPRARASA
jgi:hypothetical protein